MDKETRKWSMYFFDWRVYFEKISLDRCFAKGQKELAACSLLYNAKLKEFRALKWESHAAIMNACSYINIACYDISILMQDYAYSGKASWRRKLIARTLAIQVFELGLKLPKHFDKKFRQNLDKFNIPAKLVEDLNKALKSISQFQNTHSKLFECIRHFAGAHRDWDTVEMMRIIEEIDDFQFQGIIMEFWGLLMHLGKTLTPIFIHACNIPPPELTAQS